MVNLLRAQWYRLVRNRAFWGLLAVYAVLVFLFVAQVNEENIRQGAYRNLPAPRGVSEDASMMVGIEAILGEFWVPQLLAMFVAFLAAAFFEDDFRYEGIRLLDTGPFFRGAYVGSAALLIGLVSALFLVMAMLVTWLTLLRSGVLSVGFSGSFALWAFELIIASASGALVVLAVVAATGRAGWGVAAIFLIAAIPSWLVTPLWILGGEGAAVAFAGSMPGMQLQRLCYAGFAPTMGEALSLVPWLFVALGLCWLVMRRKRL